MKISLIMEGMTEKVFLPHLRAFLQTRLPGKMPKLDPVPCNGRIPTGEKLRRQVETLLSVSKEPADAVIALTDVYTGSQPPDFVDAADAKAKMRRWVGKNERFYPHTANTTSRRGCYGIGRGSSSWPRATAPVREATPSGSTT